MHSNILKLLTAKNLLICCLLTYSVVLGKIIHRTCFTQNSSQFEWTKKSFYWFKNLKHIETSQIKLLQVEIYFDIHYINRSVTPSVNKKASKV